MSRFRNLFALSFASLVMPLACGEAGLVGGECKAGFVPCHGECKKSCDGETNTGGDAASDDASDAGHDAKPDATQPDATEGSAPDADAAPTEAGDGASGDADGSDCIPPYDTTDNCGACYVVCVDSEVCAPVNGSWQCMTKCPDPLVACNGTCVDLDTDPDNCGGCGNVCPSGICQAGKCVGATAGHVVVTCMSFEQNFQSSPQTTLLGNALFLPITNPVRILSYAEFSTNLITSKLQQAIGWAAQAKGRSYTLTTANTSNDVTALLDKQNYDVLFVYDQPKAPPGALGASGSAWSAAIATFVAKGGIVLVTTGGGGTAEMPALIQNAGLADVSGQSPASNTVLYNKAPADAVGVNVLSPFMSLKQTCTFQTGSIPAPDTVFVVTDSAADAGVGNPAVLHRIP